MGAILKVKNLGPIIDAELDIRKTTVFIGPQGSGKSTLAKLVAITVIHEPLDTNTFKFYGLPTSYLTNGMEVNIPSASMTFEEFEKYFEGEKENGKKPPVINLKFTPTQLVFLPAERLLISLLSESIWSLMINKVALPSFIIQFGQLFELAKKEFDTFKIKFLNIEFRHQSGKDYVYFNDNEGVPLSESASGLQSVIPMYLVIEKMLLDKEFKSNFIIEEPELNLYPTTQKNLVYYLADRCTKEDNQLLMTTHSPYILAALNNLLFAFKTAQKHPEKADEIAKIIPRESWLNPEEFAAYFVADGTARTIINPKTGLISENELDGASESIGDEFDAIMSIYKIKVHEEVY